MQNLAHLKMSNFLDLNDPSLYKHWLFVYITKETFKLILFKTFINCNLLLIF